MSAGMKPVAKCWMAVLVALGLCAPSARGDPLHTFQKDPPAAGDYFGYSVAGVGNNVLVGALYDDTGATDAGAAYLFDGTTGALLKTFQKLTPAADDLFGGSVAGVGNNVLVGAYGDDTGATNAGAAYLFDGTTGDWLETFLSPNANPGDRFGESVAGVGDNVLVGAYYDDTGVTNAGAAYLFDRTTGDVRRFQKPTPASEDYFGCSVAGVGNNVLVGACKDDTGATNAGAAYLFNGTTGELLRIFQKPTPASEDYFGVYVAAVGNNVLVGAPYENAGAAYLFNGTTGALLHTFLNPTPATGGYFGASVAGVGSNVLVGGYAAGAAYLFDGTTGALLNTFQNPTPASGDWLGTSVAGVGNNVLVGAYDDDTGATNAGAAYLFQGIPEPFSAAFMGSALVGVVACRLRKRRAQPKK